MVVLLSNICAALAAAILLSPLWLMTASGNAEIGGAIVVLGQFTAWTLTTLVLAASLLTGGFDWIPARPELRWVMVLSTFAVLALFSVAVAPQGSISIGRFALAAAIPLWVLAYLVLVLNPAIRQRLHLPVRIERVPAILTGGVAAALATVSIPFSVEAVHENWRQTQAQLQQVEERRTERLREERDSLNHLARLPEDAGLFELLPFVEADSGLARGQAIERISRMPGLAARLATVIEAGDPALRRQAVVYLKGNFAGPARLVCNPVANYMAQLRESLPAQLAEPWPRNRDYYVRAAGAMEASRHLIKLGCELEQEREQWARSLKTARGGLLRDLLSSKLHTTDSGVQPKLVTTAASR